MSLYSSLTDEQIASLIVEKCSRIRRNLTYEQLPQYVRSTADTGGRLGGLAETSTSEYERAKQAIKGMANFNDPRKQNDSFTIEFQGVVNLDNARGIAVEFFGDDSTIRIIGGNWPSLGPGYLDGFAITFPSGVNNHPTTELQYRRIISSSTINGFYTLTLDQPVSGALAALSSTPGLNQFAYLSFPDRLDLPSTLICDPRNDGTTLPSQQLRTQVESMGLDHTDQNKIIVLPNRDYLLGIPAGTWEGWSISLIDGAHASEDFLVEDHIIFGGSHILSIRGIAPAVSEDDFFMLVPPGDQFISVADNAYSGMYVRVAVTGPADIKYGGTGVPAQTRQIISSEFYPLSRPARSEAFIYNPYSNSGSEFEYPPPYNAKIGVSDTFVELAQLAEYLGIYLDDLDAEALQREQLVSAYEFHRIRGTKEAVELLCRLRGFDTVVEEAVSTFTPDPGVIINSNVGNSISVEHKQFKPSELTQDLVVPQSGRGTPRSFVDSVAGRNASRVPDSDISIFLERVNPLAIQSSDAFVRLYRQIRDFALPAHVDIIFFGLLQRLTNDVDIGLNVTVGALNALAVEVTTNLYFAPIGAATSEIPLETTISNVLLLISPLRYDTTVRWSDGDVAVDTGVPRWTTGNTRLI